MDECPGTDLFGSPHGSDTQRAPGAGGGELRGAAVVLAIGHTASRDAFPALAARGVAMVPKPFALGFRMEHPQALIDELQLGARLAEGAQFCFRASLSLPLGACHDTLPGCVCAGPERRMAAATIALLGLPEGMEQGPIQPRKLHVHAVTLQRRGRRAARQGAPASCRLPVGR